jgi:D-3-phosphoglycerate dehydrogenase
MKVFITDHGFPDVHQEREIINAAGHELLVGQCKTAEAIIVQAAAADALLVQWAPVNASVIDQLKQCRVIVRYGIGVDNVDLKAATACGIPVCNVPDYCIDEVADHAMAMALSLVRQLSLIDYRLRSGTWKITPDYPMPALRNMTLATAGFGRIARAVLERARAFGCRLAAYDPYVTPEVFTANNVTRLTMEELFTQADVLSLHLPLTPETRHLINSATLAKMKPTSIVINTARGGLIDAVALAAALQAGVIAGAGLDVFDPEPLPDQHPLRRCKNAILTSHIGWFSDQSVPKLQRLAAEEVVRALRGEALKHQVNQ